MIAVMPDWQVLHLGTSAAGARVTVRISAATASMTMAMAMGIPNTTGSLVWPGTVRNWGNNPASTTSATPPKKMNALAFAPRFSGAGSAGVRATEYLRKLPLRSIVDASAVLLALPNHEGAREHLLQAVTSDGGWGVRQGAPAEAFDTAVALLALRSIPSPPRDAIRRGRAWLVAHQLDNGGWTETTRPSGGSSYAQHVSTTAWALMALLETAK